MSLNRFILLSCFLSILSISQPVLSHSHHHHEKLPHQEGIFEDEQVEDRTLSDWTGDWQSVYPYMISGDLDMVMRYKSNQEDATKTFEEYKTYYLKGYETDVDRIIIDGESGEIIFYRGDKSVSATYQYEGYKILTYASGKKGVRYLFTSSNPESDAPQFIQFSDHEIAPTQSHHFHLFFSDEPHEVLLEEMENWPTYYPSELDRYEIVDEMIAH